LAKNDNEVTEVTNGLPGTDSMTQVASVLAFNLNFRGSNPHHR